MSDAARDRRLAGNEALFREVNELVKDVSAHWHEPDEPVQFRCECAVEDCVARVALLADEYERIRANSLLFFVAQGHENLEIERVVGEGDGYYVVEKIGVGRDVAAESDPRG